MHTFLGCLVLTVLEGAGSPGAPGRHLALHGAGDLAQLGGVGGDPQAQLTAYGAQGCGHTHTHRRLSLIDLELGLCASGPIGVHVENNMCSAVVEYHLIVQPGPEMCFWQSA